MNVSLRKIEAQGRKPGQRGKGKHGIYAYLASGKLPSGRSWKKTQAQVLEIRKALIQQYGGDSIQPAVLALIESAIEGLTIQRLAGLYVKKAGILRVDSLGKGNLELHSILSGQFISYANLVRLNLESAARLAAQSQGKQGEINLGEIIQEYHDAKETAAGGATLAQEGRSLAGEAKGHGQPAGAGGMRNWKAVERRIARELGGERVGNRGTGCEDVTHPLLSIEVKTRTELPAFLKRSYGQARANAAEGKTPVLVLKEKGKRFSDCLVALRLADFLDAMEGHR